MNTARAYQRYLKHLGKAARFSSVVPPTHPARSRFLSATSAELRKTKHSCKFPFSSDTNSTETGYRVEWSEDGSD